MSYTVALDFIGHNQNFHAVIDSKRKDRRDNYFNSIDLTPKDKVTYYSQIGDKTILDPVIDTKHAHVDVEHNRLKETTYEKDSEGNVTDTLLVNPESTTFQPDSELSSELVKYHGKDKVVNPNDIVNLNVVMRDSVTETKFIPSNNVVVPLNKIKQNDMSSYINKTHTSTSLSTTLLKHHKVQTSNFDISTKQDTVQSDLVGVDSYIESIFSCCGLTKTVDGVVSKVHLADLIKVDEIKEHYDNIENLLNQDNWAIPVTEEGQSIQDKTSKSYILKCRYSSLFQDDISELAKKNILVYGTTCLSCLELLSEIESAKVTDDLLSFITKFNIEVVSFNDYFNYICNSYVQLIKNVYHKKYNYDQYVKTTDNRKQLEISDPEQVKLSITPESELDKPEVVVNNLHGLSVYHYDLSTQDGKYKYIATDKTLYVKPSSTQFELTEEKPCFKIHFEDIKHPEHIKEFILYKKSLETPIYTALVSTESFWSDKLIQCEYISVEESEIPEDTQLEEITATELTVDTINKDVVKGQIIQNITESTLSLEVFDSIFDKKVKLGFEFSDIQEAKSSKGIIYYKTRVWKLDCQKSDKSLLRSYIYFNTSVNMFVNNKSQEGKSTIEFTTETNRSVKTSEFRYYAKLDKSTMFHDWLDESVAKTQLRFIVDIDYITYAIDCKLDSKVSECSIILQHTGFDMKGGKVYSVTECYDDSFDEIEVKQSLCQTVQVISPDLYKITFQDKNNTPITDVDSVLSQGYLAQFNLPLTTGENWIIKGIIPRKVKDNTITCVKVGNNVILSHETVVDNKYKFSQLQTFESSGTLPNQFTNTKQYQDCKVYRLTSLTQSVQFGDVTIDKIPIREEIAIVIYKINNTKSGICGVYDKSFKLIDAELSDDVVTTQLITMTPASDEVKGLATFTVPVKDKSSNLIFYHQFEDEVELMFIQFSGDVTSGVIPIYCKFGDKLTITDIYDAAFTKIYPLNMYRYTLQSDPTFIPQAVRQLMNKIEPMSTKYWLPQTIVEHRLLDDDLLKANLLILDTSNSTAEYYTVVRFPSSTDDEYVLQNEKDVTTRIKANSIEKTDVVDLKKTIDVKNIKNIITINDVYRKVASDLNTIVIEGQLAKLNYALLHPFTLNEDINVLIHNGKFKLIDTDIELLETQALQIPTIEGTRYVQVKDVKDYIFKTFDLTLPVKYTSGESTKFALIKLDNVSISNENYNSIEFDVVESHESDKVSYSIEPLIELTSTTQSVGVIRHTFEDYKFVDMTDAQGTLDYVEPKSVSTSKDMIKFTLTKSFITSSLKSAKDKSGVVLDDYYVLPLKFKKIESDEIVTFTTYTDSDASKYFNSALTFYFDRDNYKCIGIVDELGFAPKFEDFKYDESTLYDFVTVDSKFDYVNRHHVKMELVPEYFTIHSQFRASAQYKGYNWDIKLDELKASKLINDVPVEDTLKSIVITLEFNDSVSITEVSGTAGQTISYENPSIEFTLTSSVTDKHQNFTLKGRYVYISSNVNEYIKQVLDKDCIAFKTNVVDVDEFDDAKYSQQLGFYFLSSIDVRQIRDLDIVFDVNSVDIYSKDFKLKLVKARYTDNSFESHDITHQAILIPFYVDELYNITTPLSTGSAIIKLMPDEYKTKIARETLYLSVDVDGDTAKTVDFVFNNIQYPKNSEGIIDQAIRPIAYVVGEQDEETLAVKAKEVVCLTYDSRDDEVIDRTGREYTDSHVAQSEETQIIYSEAHEIKTAPKTLSTDVNLIDCYDFKGIELQVPQKATTVKYNALLTSDKYVTLTFTSFDDKQIDTGLVIDRIIIAQSETPGKMIDETCILAMSSSKLIKCTINVSDIKDTNISMKDDKVAEVKLLCRAVATEIVSSKTGSPEAALAVKLKQYDDSFTYYTIQCAAPTTYEVENDQILEIPCKQDNGLYVLTNVNDIVVRDSVTEKKMESCRINKIIKVNAKRISKAKKEEYLELKFTQAKDQQLLFEDINRYIYLDNILAKDGEDETNNLYTITKLEEFPRPISVNVTNITCNDNTMQHAYITSVKGKDDIIYKGSDVSKIRIAKEVLSSDASTVTSLNQPVQQLVNIEYPFSDVITDDKPEPVVPENPVKPIDLMKESVGYILSLFKDMIIIKHKFTSENSGYFTVYYIYDQSEVLQYITIGHLVFSLEDVKSIYPTIGQVDFIVKNTTFKSEAFIIKPNVDSKETLVITSDIKPFGVLDVIFKDLIVKKSSMEFEVDSLKLYQQDFKDISYINDCRVKCDVIFTQGMCINNYEPILRGKCVDIDIVSGVLLKNFRLLTTIVCKKLSFNGDRLVITEGYFENYPYIPINSDVIILSSGQLEITPIAKSDSKMIQQLSLMTVKITSGARLFFVPVKIVKVKSDEYINTFIQPWASTEQLLGLTPYYTIPKRSFVEYDRFMSMIKPTTFQINKDNTYLEEHKVKSTQVRYSLDECNIDLSTSE